MVTTRDIIVKSTPHMTPPSPPSLKLWETLQKSFPQPAKGWGSVGERLIVGKREFCRFLNIIWYKKFALCTFTYKISKCGADILILVQKCIDLVKLVDIAKSQ